MPLKQRWNNDNTRRTYTNYNSTLTIRQSNNVEATSRHHLQINVGDATLKRRWNNVDTSTSNATLMTWRCNNVETMLAHQLLAMQHRKDVDASTNNATFMTGHCTNVETTLINTSTNNSKCIIRRWFYVDPTPMHQQSFDVDHRTVKRRQ